jgi:hypothetical protein
VDECVGGCWVGGVCLVRRFWATLHGNGAFSRLFFPIFLSLIVPFVPSALANGCRYRLNHRHRHLGTAFPLLRSSPLPPQQLSLDRQSHLHFGPPSRTEHTSRGALEPLSPLPLHSDSFLTSHLAEQPVESCPCFEDTVAFLSVVLGAMIGVSWTPQARPTATLGWERRSAEEVALWVGAVGVKLVGGALLFFLSCVRSSL